MQAKNNTNLHKHLNQQSEMGEKCVIEAALAHLHLNFKTFFISAVGFSSIFN
jgi:hypothetical protein